MLKEHNKEAYEATKAMLLEHRECCLVAATGIGKSNITTELIQELGVNALIIVPKKSIQDNWDKIPDEYGVPPTFSTVTYQFFCKHYKQLYGFEAYIFDECHHAGAPVWGKAIKDFRENLDNEFVLGLTADPTRYSDLDIKNRNVINTVFNGHAVYGHDHKSAIEAGILPKASYICTLYDTEGLFRSYANKKMTDELRGRFNYTVANCESIENIIRKHLPSNVPIKGIIFVDSIKNIDIGISLAKRCFPEENIYSIHSKKSNCKNIKMLDTFRCAKSGFIISINMLNEGLHIQGVNTIIMLRKTSSPAVYMQQIGRGLSIDSKNITIYDLVRNDTSIKKTIDRIRNEEERFFRNKKNRKCDSDICIFSDQSIIKDYATDILTVLNEIDEYESERHRWTEEEDQIIRDNYPKLGKKIKEMLPGREVYSIIARVNKLNVYFEDKKWSDEELLRLKNNYPSMGKKVIELFPDRTLTSCLVKAHRLGLKMTSIRWTEQEDEILCQYYPLIGIKVVELLPGRSKNACLTRAINKFNLKVVK